MEIVHSELTVKYLGLNFKDLVVEDNTEVIVLSIYTHTHTYTHIYA